MAEENFEAEARKQGWAPQEQWKGDPEKWVDAQTFVERGEKIAGIATKQNKDLRAEVEELRATVEEVRTVNTDLKSHYQRALEKERREAEAQIAALKKQRIEAINEADGERVQQIEDKLESLRTMPPEQQQWAVEWADENPWYAKDPEAREVAEGIATRLSASGKFSSPREMMDEVAKRVKKAMPHKFENPRRKQSVTEGNASIEQESGEKSYASLPPDAKAACDRFVAEGVMSKDEYIATYDWS